MGSGASNALAASASSDDVAGPEPGPMGTKNMSLEPQELDAADAMWQGSMFTEEEKSLLSGMVGYVATTSLESEECKMPIRYLPGSGDQVALCLHGLGEDRCMALWSHFWMPMLKKGFHVVALDLPGFGRATACKTTKAWSMDGELLLRLMEVLKVPEGSVSVFAEGVGACLFLRAYAQDPTPFAAHHVLLNVQIGEVPKGLQEKLEMSGADLMLCACEKFYPEQPPWMVAGINQLASLLLDPSNMGLLGQMILWKVKDANGPTPFKSMRDELWWTGALQQTAMTSSPGRSLVFTASSECFEELLNYAAAPRKVVKATGPLGPLGGPEMSAIEMGEINDTFAVFIRIRPLLEREVKKGSSNCFVVSDTTFPRDPPPQRIVVQSDGASVKGSFVFNRVFEESFGQEAIYMATAKPYVQDFLTGTNVTIFAYGQTGTGKTYTIAGPAEDPGIVCRCLTGIFQGLPADKELYYEYVQLYLDDFKDLLVPDAKDLGKLVDGKAGVELPGLSSHKATSAKDVLKALEKGASRRATRSQDMNEVSSRSHAILMLRLKDAHGTIASMFIVDLAGSERVARSGVTGEGFDEATNINLSLTALGRVVITLLDNAKAFIPYNASPLTMLLKTGLGGNSKTALIACVTQSADSLSESVSTLRFAMQASHVKNKVAKQEAQDQADLEKEKLAEAGNHLELVGGKGMVTLTSGELEVWGSWTSAAENTVLLLGGLGADLAELQEVIAALKEKGCQVLAPKLPGSAEKHLDSDIQILLEFMDWLGLAKPVLYGRDWGGIRAIKFKILHPKRASTLVLENAINKLNPAQYKAKMKQDPGYALNENMGPWLWLWDGAFPKTLDGTPGNNVKGFKGKVVFLWPYHMQGRHEPTGKSSSSVRCGMAYAKTLKTKLIDSYLMTDADVAAQIIAQF